MERTFNVLLAMMLMAQENLCFLLKQSMETWFGDRLHFPIIFKWRGKGQLDISQYVVHEEIFKKGESYRLVIAPSGPINVNEYFTFPLTYIPFVAE